MKINFKTKLTNMDGLSVFLVTKNFFDKNKCENLMKEYNFKADYNEKIILSKDNKLNIIIGLGDESKINNIKLEQFGNELFKYLELNKFKNVILYYNFDNNTKNFVDDNDKNLLDILKGIELSDYKFNKYFLEEKKEKTNLENLTLIMKNDKKIEDEYKEFLILKENIFLCRNLVNEPSNVINPETYSEICTQLSEYGLDVEILNEEQMSELGMNSLLSVGQGSSFESKLVILKWKGLKTFNNPIAFVGKGITFDSGGLSLKPDNAMLDMKYDMAGSAVVVSLMKLLAQRKSKVNAVGVVGLVENMPSGSAVKPGDIVESMSKQTVEILNTDAEGRLILADELYYTITKFKPQTIIDLATLTGACCVALGDINAGVFTNNDDLAEEIRESSEKTGELSWRLPLGEIGSKYDKLINSDVADVKNISGIRYAGAITASQFLQRFINNHKKWAHIDIAGTAFLDKEGYFVKNGATGYGVRLLDNLVKNNYENK